MAQGRRRHKDKVQRLTHRRYYISDIYLRRYFTRKLERLEVGKPTLEAGSCGVRFAAPEREVTIEN